MTVIGSYSCSWCRMDHTLYESRRTEEQIYEQVSHEHSQNSYNQHSSVGCRCTSGNRPLGTIDSLPRIYQSKLIRMWSLITYSTYRQFKTLWCVSFAITANIGLVGNHISEDFVVVEVKAAHRKGYTRSQDFLARSCTDGCMNYE